MYNGTKVLDVHGHISTPPEFFAHAALLLAANSPVRELSIPDERMAGPQENHLKVLDERSVDVQVIGPRPFAQFLWARPHIQAAWARATNNAIAQAVRMHTARFLGMAHLPQHSEIETSNCVPELERAVMMALGVPLSARSERPAAADGDDWITKSLRQRILKGC